MLASLLVTVSAAAGPAGVSAAGGPAGGTPTPAVLCDVSDKRVAELSGLATDGGSGRWAVPDGGRQVRVYQLGPDCAVRAVLTAPLDPVDPEDLARTSDGTLWLADTGDNDRERDTVALLALTPGGRITRHSLRYPDGPHDVEALLLGPDRTPLLVTKELFGPAGVYRPPRALGEDTASGVLELRRVAEVSLPASDTRGGPIAGLGSRTITGGATTADGRIAALRTYTDAWLFSAPDGDLVAALGSRPVRVPLPGEPQGEAIAFDAEGGLLSGSERRGGTDQEPSRDVPPAGPPGQAGLAWTDPAWRYGGAALLALVCGAVLLVRRRRRT